MLERLDELEQLLRQATDRVAANDIWKQINGLLCRLAKFVAFRLGVQDDEFVNEAPSIIFERYGKFDPTKSHFGFWCRKVLKNWAIDRFRRLERSPLDSGDDLDELPDRPSQKSLFSIVGTGIFDKPFSDADIRAITTWKPSTRIVLLCLSGLWVKVSTEQWMGWCKEAGVDSEFPPNNIRVEDNPSKRIRLLAECLGERPNTISQQWKRGKEKLRLLQALRESRNND